MALSSTKMYGFSLLLLYFLTPVTVAEAKPQVRIVGGQESTPSDWPFMVAVMKKVRELRLGEQMIPALSMSGEDAGEVVGKLTRCIKSGEQLECQDVVGAVCLIERDGETHFFEMIKACQGGEGIGGIIFNNEPGNFAGTLQDFKATIPAVGISQEDGAILLAFLGEQISIRYSAQVPDSAFCGGALIDPHWILTAAHCMVNQQPESLLVNIGGHDLETDQNNVFEVDKIISHMHFNPDTISNDVAVLKLNVAASGIEPVVRADADFLDQAIEAGTNATVLGRGLQAAITDSEEPPAAEEIKKLFQVDLPLVSNATCNQAFLPNLGTLNAVTNNMLCAGRAEGGIGTCFGDSGGPLLLAGSDGRFQLAGITSWGVGCAQPELYDVYARVPFFAEEIDAVISGKSINLEPISPEPDPPKPVSPEADSLKPVSSEPIYTGLGSGAWGLPFLLFLGILGVLRRLANIQSFLSHTINQPSYRSL